MLSHAWLWCRNAGSGPRQSSTSHYANVRGHQSRVKLGRCLFPQMIRLNDEFLELMPCLFQIPSEIVS